MWILYLIILLCFILILGKILINRGKYWEKRGVKSIPFSTLKVFSSGKSIGEMDLEVYREYMKDENYVGINDFMTGPVFIPKDLDVVKRILVKDFEHFPNRIGFSSENSGDVSTKMLVNRTGTEWKSLRSTLSPIFSTGKIKRLFYAFDECANNLDIYLKQKINQSEGNVVDVQNAFQRFAMSIIARSVFGIESNSFATEEDPFFLKMAKRLTTITPTQILKFFTGFIAPSIIKYFKIPVFEGKSSEYFEKIIKDAIKSRKNLGENEKFNDFLELMLESRKNNGENSTTGDEKLDNFEKEAQLNVKSKAELDDDYIHAQCLLFFFAGFDTTETALTFATYELALNPEIQEKLRKEIDSIVEKHGKLEYDSLTNNNYLNNVINETLRKYPPASRTDRKCVKDYYIEEYNLTIEKNVNVQIPIIGFHFDPKYFPNPEKFDPNRFEPEEKEKRHPYAYMPFGHGPRNCIGMRFALQEVKILLAHLVKNFYIEPSKDTMIPPKYYAKSFSMKPLGGMKLTLTPKN